MAWLSAGGTDVQTFGLTGDTPSVDNWPRLDLKNETLPGRPGPVPVLMPSPAPAKPLAPPMSYAFQAQMQTTKDAAGRTIFFATGTSYDLKSVAVLRFTANSDTDRKQDLEAHEINLLSVLDASAPHVAGAPAFDLSFPRTNLDPAQPVSTRSRSTVAFHLPLSDDAKSP